jgi:CRP/FNR family cyclic AMP-dependent transcriptional regulator
MEFTAYDTITNEEKYQDGDIIFEEGSSGNWVYVVISGSVEISKTLDGRKHILNVLEPGEIFGELSLIGDVRRTATVQAIGETTVGVIDRSFLDTEFNKLSATFRPVLVTIVERFVSMMDRTRDLSSRREDRVKRTLSLKFKDRQAFLNAYANNISTGGLFIKTQKPLEVKEKFFLKLQLPGIKETLQIQCEVIWARKQTDDAKKTPLGMGVEFCEMAESDSQVLKKYMAEEEKDLED